MAWIASHYVYSPEYHLIVTVEDQFINKSTAREQLHHDLQIFHYKTGLTRFHVPSRQHTILTSSSDDLDGLIREKHLAGEDG